MSEIEQIVRDYLSPRAQKVVSDLFKIRDEGAKISEAVNSVREEGWSEDESVWACADGQGFIKALVIDDEAIRDNSAEELEELITDAMIEASGNGQAVGEELTKDVVPETVANGI